MREQKDRCIFFVLENFFFLIPLPFVDKVIGNPLAEGVNPETGYVDLWEGSGKDEKNKYWILFSSGDEILGMPASEVLGFPDIGESRIWELPEQVCRGQNRYISAAVAVRTEDGKTKLAYLLDAGELRNWKKAAQGAEGSGRI